MPDPQNHPNIWQSHWSVWVSFDQFDVWAMAIHSSPRAVLVNQDLGSFPEKNPTIVRTSSPLLHLDRDPEEGVAINRPDMQLFERKAAKHHVMNHVP